MLTTGQVSTLAGLATQSGPSVYYGMDGDFGSASFVNLKGLAFDPFGFLLASDGNRIRRVSSEGSVCTVAGCTGTSKSKCNSVNKNEVGPAASFEDPRKLALVTNPNGNATVYLTSGKQIRLLHVIPFGDGPCDATVHVGTAAGDDQDYGEDDGRQWNGAPSWPSATAAKFFSPLGLAADVLYKGNLYVVDQGNLTSANAAPSIRYLQFVERPLVPKAWLCPAYNYDSSDGCDCNCGAPDPDCAAIEGYNMNRNQTAADCPSEYRLPNAARECMFCPVLTKLPDAKRAAGSDADRNLVMNGGCESTPDASWQSIPGRSSWSCSASAARAGSKAITITAGEIWQDIPLGLEAGAYAAAMSLVLTAYLDTSGELIPSPIKLDFFSGNASNRTGSSFAGGSADPMLLRETNRRQMDGGASWKHIESGNFRSSSWTSYQSTVVVPPDARMVRVTLTGPLRADDVSLRLPKGRYLYVSARKLAAQRQQEASGGDGDGSIENPFLSMRAAFTKATSGDVVFMIPGRYTGDRNLQFGIDSSDMLRADVSRWTVSLSGASYTIIDMQSQGRFASFMDVPADSVQLLQGIAFVMGNAKSGGALYVGRGAVNLVGVVFAKNYATGLGGALYMNKSSADLVDANFTDNRANIAGGAAYALQSQPRFRRTIFSSNSAPTGSGIHFQECNGQLSGHAGTCCLSLA